MLADVVTVDGTDVPMPVAHVARDPLDPKFNRDGVVTVLRRKHSEIKRQLLDQTVVSGIGNIYADEALWRAKINGARLASSLTRAKLGEVLDAAAEVMTEALGPGRHVVRLAVCQRQRRVRLFRAVAGRLRPRGGAMPALRRGDAAGEVHEPLVVLLPDDANRAHGSGGLDFADIDVLQVGTRTFPANMWIRDEDEGKRHDRTVG